MTVTLLLTVLMTVSSALGLDAKQVQRDQMKDLINVTMRMDALNERYVQEMSERA